MIFLDGSLFHIYFVCNLRAITSHEIGLLMTLMVMTGCENDKTWMTEVTLLRNVIRQHMKKT